MLGLFFDEYGFAANYWCWLIAGGLLGVLAIVAILVTSNKVWFLRYVETFVFAALLYGGLFAYDKYKPSEAGVVGYDGARPVRITDLQELENCIGNFKRFGGYYTLAGKGNLLVDFPNVPYQAMKERYVKCESMLKELGFEREAGEPFVADVMFACREINQWRAERDGRYAEIVAGDSARKAQYLENRARKAVAAQRDVDIDRSLTKQ